MRLGTPKSVVKAVMNRDTSAALLSGDDVVVDGMDYIQSYAHKKLLARPRAIANLCWANVTEEYRQEVLQPGPFSDN